MSRQVDIKALVSHIVKGDGGDRCRICMGDTSEGQVFLGDTVMMDGDKPVTLTELLQVITGVEVPWDGDLPDSICYLCSAAAFAAADFRTLCRQSSNHWNNLLDLLVNMPVYQYSKNISKITVVLKDDCITIIEEEIKEVADRTVKPVRKEHREEYTKSIQCECPNCGKRFIYAQHLSQHLKESTDFQRACYICAEIMTRECLIKHLNQKHKKQPYDCMKCPALFRSKMKYKEHLSKAHKQGSCTCGDCGRSFRSAKAFHAHTSVHASKNCPNCNKLFRNQTCYRYHVKQCCNLDKNREDTYHTKHKVTVLVERQNKAVKVGMRGSADTECICDYCHKKFAGKKFVAAHIQIVHLKNTHRPCMYCGKLLAAARMTTHLKKHEETLFFKCEHCGCVLKSKLGYQQHLRLHSGEKPYTCNYCTEAFSASSRRSEHVRKVHKQEEVVLKHACEKCPARFRLPYRLKKHVDTVHSKDMKYQCNACNEMFVSCRALLIHSRNYHNNRS